MTQTLTTLRSGFRGPRRSRGVAAVEFVVSVPVLLFVMLAAAEIGRAFVQYDTLSYSVRSGARYATENVIQGTSGAIDVGDVADETANLVVYGTPSGGGTPCLPGFAPGDVTVLNAGGGNVEVIGEYGYDPMLKIVLPTFGGTGPTSMFTMRIAITMKAIS
jgi:Flp pilus assembly protein TadG